ncbi:hypothetical protein BCR34DRAFT_87541 [Clohesyomyces aquaticus]|uniref:Uncharacterized protein n=1 Tax=Clohesyomyces aquaticus TaxID=1231657 RepID=A0A1Y2A3D9_9PLEO|nr:hypothetical protein BCR34DRAFT_87541 [Clohesyomyces aquaticus]
MSGNVDYIKEQRNTSFCRLRPPRLGSFRFPWLVKHSEIKHGRCVVRGALAGQDQTRDWKPHWGRYATSVRSCRRSKTAHESSSWPLLRCQLQPAPTGSLHSSTPFTPDSVSAPSRLRVLTRRFCPSASPSTLLPRPGADPFPPRLSQAHHAFLLPTSQPPPTTRHHPPPPIPTRFYRLHECIHHSQKHP